MTQFNHAGIDWDLAKLPPASVLALVKSGLSHKLGNEVSSAVSAFFKSTTPEGQEVPASDSEVYRAKKAEIFNEKVQAIHAGTLGEGRVSAGPRVSPFEREFANIVKSELLAKLRASGAIKGSKNPADDQEFRVKGKTFTWTQLQASYGESQKARIEKEVKTKLDAIAKKAKALESTGLDDLIAD